MTFILGDGHHVIGHHIITTDTRHVFFSSGIK